MKQTKADHIRSLLRAGMRPSEITREYGYHNGYVRNIAATEPAVRMEDDLIQSLRVATAQMQRFCIEQNAAMREVAAELARLRAEVAILRGLDPAVTNLRVAILQAEDMKYPDRKRRAIRQQLRALLDATAAPVGVAVVAEPVFQLAD